MTITLDQLQHPRTQIWSTVLGTVMAVVLAFVAFSLTRDDAQEQATESVQSTLDWIHAGQGCDGWVTYSDSAAAMTRCLDKERYALTSVDVVADDHASRTDQRCAVAKAVVEGTDGRETWAFTRALDSQRWVYSGLWTGLDQVVCSTTR